METWKAVVGYEGLYEVSDLGRVKSLERYVPRFHRGQDTVMHIKEKFMKTPSNGDGYPSTGLCKNGVRCSFKVHTLVATHFISNPYNKLEVNHIDGNKFNNSTVNLEWLTKLENMQHSWKVGLHTATALPRGSRHGMSKLNEHYVKLILDLRQVGYSQRRVAKIFHVDKNVIALIDHNKLWKHVSRS